MATIIVLMFSGCQNIQTQKRSNELMTSVPDLYYQQVLDNLAMISANPGALPFFGVPGTSTDTNTRQINASYSLGWDFISSAGVFLGRYLVDKQSTILGGQMMNAQAFQLAPLSDPDKLTLIQIALRIAAGKPISSGEKQLFEAFYIARVDTIPIYYYYYHAITRECLDDIKPSTQPPDKKSPSQGPPTCPERDEQSCEFQRADWIHVCGRKSDIPKCACYTGHYCDTWVWVPADRHNDLTSFTLAILDLATLGQAATGRFASIGGDRKKALQALAEGLVPSPTKDGVVAPEIKAQRENLVKFLSAILPEPQGPVQTLLPARTSPTILQTPPGM
jgi:hypothetical protein